MKLVKTLLATTLVLSAFSTFAANSKDKDPKADNVITSSKDQPVNAETTAAGQPTSTQPNGDVAVEESTVTPSTTQPTQ